MKPLIDANRPARLFWNRFRRNRLALAGGAVVAVLFGLAALAGWLAPFDPNKSDRSHVVL